MDLQSGDGAQGNVEGLSEGSLRGVSPGGMNDTSEGTEADFEAAEHVVEPAESPRYRVRLEPLGGDDLTMTRATLTPSADLVTPITAALTLVGDDGSGTLASASLGAVTVQPGGLAEVIVDVSMLGFDLDALLFAGSVTLVATVDPPVVDGTSGAVGIESEHSNPLYFHPATPGDGLDQDLVWHTELPSHRGDFRGVVVPNLAPGDGGSGDALGATPLLDRIVGQPKKSPTPADEGLASGDAELAGEALDASPDPTALHVPGSTHAVNKTLCAEWLVSAKDSAVMFRSTAGTPPVPGLSVPPKVGTEDDEEDWGPVTGDGSVSNGWLRPMENWRARNAGFRLCKKDPLTGWCYLGTTQWLDATGCKTVSVDVGEEYFFELQSQAKDANDNLWRVYEEWVSGVKTCPSQNGSGNVACDEDTPGAPLGVATVITFGTASTKWVSIVGADQNHWSTTAFVAAALYRQRNGLAGTHLNACLSASDSSQVLDANWTLGRACLEIGSGNQPQRKYLVAHEIGHAVSAMSAQDDFNGASLDYDAEYEKDSVPGGVQGSNTSFPSGCPPGPGNESQLDPLANSDYVQDFIDTDDDLRADAGECYAPCTNYNLNSMEWDSVALREGWAHFYATRVMNDRARHAAFTWNNTPEVNALVKFRLDDFVDELAEGLGRLHSVCCEPTGMDPAPANCDDDASTIRDWTGALWNWYASYWDEDCAGIAYVDWTDVVAVMDATLQVNPNSKKGAWNEYSAAVAARWSGTPCQETTWTDQGDEFELDN